MVSLLLIPAFAIANHVRGGGGLFGTRVVGLLQRIPGNGDITAAPFVAMMAWAAGVSTLGLPGWASSLIFALCWLAWSTPAWGFLQGLGRGPGPINERQPSWYEALFIRAAGGNPHVAFGFRTTLFLIPMAINFGWLWLILGPLQVAAYEIGWRIKSPGIAVGELMTGALWGAALILLA
ncbi:hypothetical protein BA190_09340 [Labrys sp. WJW]|uniref:hypothetical protein n=1 Tax=Labrys sp. WJW TaxID=1737983 RepID=UPI00082D90BE|nr:hypothetical protein [Labrys sp. WJW]OCC05109.1 hypothetical protein BA190_09340 [Labrys sp. WJW]